jgi:hypothetical protein
MAQPPYGSDQRVFWIVDNVTIHRGWRPKAPLWGQQPSLVPVDLPIQRTGSARSRSTSRSSDACAASAACAFDAAAQRILGFQERYQHRNSSDGASRVAIWLGCSAAPTSTSSFQQPHHAEYVTEVSFRSASRVSQKRDVFRTLTPRSESNVTEARSQRTDGFRRGGAMRCWRR